MSDNSPKHIVIDARSRPSSTGRYVDRLLDHLQKIDSKNHYTILLRIGDTWLPTGTNFTTKTCPFKQFSFNIMDQIRYAHFLRQLQPDLVHFGMTPQEPMFYFGKRITTTHDLTMLRFARPGKLPGWLHALRMVGYRLLFWWSLHLAKRIIVPSQFVAHDMSQTYPFTKDKITVTYEASEPPLPNKATQLEGVRKPFIMHVGSPFPHKNIERLIAAFELLKQKQPHLQLVLVGKKEQYFKRLEHAIRQGSLVRKDIIIPGFVSDAELKWLYENAETYVLPSLSEGFGLPGLEAMVHGCPLVSSNATCLPEVYGDAAHYFDPKNILDITTQINAVISNQHLRLSLIKKGHVQVKKYSWQRMAKQTLIVYAATLK